MNLTLLPKDPKCLYVFWDSPYNDISQNSASLPPVPYLRITNMTLESSFLVRVNGFSDNWYINVPDAACVYKAEYGTKLPGDAFEPIAASNPVSTAGDCIGSSLGIEFADYNDIRDGNYGPGMYPIPHNEGIPTDDQHSISEDAGSSRKGYNE